MASLREKLSVAATAAHVHDGPAADVLFLLSGIFYECPMFPMLLLARVRPVYITRFLESMHKGHNQGISWVHPEFPRWKGMDHSQWTSWGLLLV